MLSQTANALLPLLQPLRKSDLRELFSLLLPQDEESYITIQQAAKRTGLSHMIFRRRIADGTLPFKRYGCRYLLKWSDIAKDIK